MHEHQHENQQPPTSKSNLLSNSEPHGIIYCLRKANNIKDKGPHQSTNLIKHIKSQHVIGFYTAETLKIHKL